MASPRLSWTTVVSAAIGGAVTVATAYFSMQSTRTASITNGDHRDISEKKQNDLSFPTDRFLDITILGESGQTHYVCEDGVFASGNSL